MTGQDGTPELERE
jgi:hypothetical protein